MRKKLLSAILTGMMAASLLTGCAGSSGSSGETSGASTQQSAAEGTESSSEETGGTVIMARGSDSESLDPVMTASNVDIWILNMVVEGLVGSSDDGKEIIPAVADTWEISDDGLTYTFHIRDNATRVTWEGEYYANVTADDFVASLEYVLDRANGSTSAGFAYPVIKNAKAYYMQKITDFSQVGVKAADEHTLVYTLEEPCPYFLSLTSYMCF